MDLQAIFNRYIGRWVAFVLAPILVPGATALSVWLQDSVGIDLDKDVIIAYVSAVGVGVSAVIYKWIANNGAFERAVVELEALYRAGDEINRQANESTTLSAPPR